MSLFIIIFSALLLLFILIGIWHEEKLIAFEDKICDRLGYFIAQVIIAHRKRVAEKSIIRIEKAYETIEREERKLAKTRQRNDRETVQADS